MPSSVYLAPYPGMDAKIALAAPGRLEILDEYDEDQIAASIAFAPLISTYVSETLPLSTPEVRNAESVIAVSYF